MTDALPLDEGAVQAACEIVVNKCKLTLKGGQLCSTDIARIITDAWAEQKRGYIAAIRTAGDLLVAETERLETSDSHLAAEQAVREKLVRTLREMVRCYCSREMDDENQPVYICGRCVAIAAAEKLDNPNV